MVVYGESSMSSPIDLVVLRSGRTRTSASPRCPALPVTRILTSSGISEPADKPMRPMLAKAELHVHLEGTAPPELV